MGTNLAAPDYLHFALLVLIAGACWTLGAWIMRAILTALTSRRSAATAPAP